MGGGELAGGDDEVGLDEDSFVANRGEDVIFYVLEGLVDDFASVVALDEADLSRRGLLFEGLAVLKQGASACGLSGGRPEELPCEREARSTEADTAQEATSVEMVCITFDDLFLSQYGCGPQYQYTDRCTQCQIA
jgi:hypothetical protein